MGNFWVAIAKLGTVIIDRRFWLYLFTVFAVVFGMPELKENADALSAEAADAVVLLVQGFTILIGMIKLIGSWENRPPSGTEYKEERIAVEVQRALKDIGIDV